MSCNLYLKFYQNKSLTSILSFPVSAQEWSRVHNIKVKSCRQISMISDNAMDGATSLFWIKENKIILLAKIRIKFCANVMGTFGKSQYCIKRDPSSVCQHLSQKIPGECQSVIHIVPPQCHKHRNNAIRKYNECDMRSNYHCSSNFWKQISTKGLNYESFLVN